jgi:hypothetical protein
VLFGDETYVEERRLLEPRSNATFEHRLDLNELGRFPDGFVGAVTLASMGEIRSEVDWLIDDLVNQVGNT